MLQLLDMISVHTLRIRDLQLSLPGTNDAMKEKSRKCFLLMNMICSPLSYCQHYRGLGICYSPVTDTWKFILYGNLSARGGTSAYDVEMFYPATEDFADNAT